MPYVFPMVEQLLQQVLPPLLADRSDVTVPWSTIRPSPTPSQFVRVLRVGGAQETPVTDAPQVTFEAYAPTQLQAHAILSAIDDALRAAVAAGSLLGREQQGGPSPLPDPLVPERERLTSRYIVRVRGALS